MSLDGSVVFLSLENDLLLALQVPLDEAAILRGSKYRFVVLTPFDCSDCLLVSFQEHLLIVNIFILPCCEVISNVVEQLPFLFKDLPLESLGQQVILICIEDVYFGLSSSRSLTL